MDGWTDPEMCYCINPLPPLNQFNQTTSDAGDPVGARHRRILLARAQEARCVPSAPKPFQSPVPIKPIIHFNSTTTQPGRAGLKLSQRIIHTRVQGQASVITILALTMGFREYMQKNGGRIKIEDDE